MDISSLSALPVTTPTRSDAGAQGLVQALAARTDFPGSAPAAPPATGSSDAPSTESLAQAVKQVNESFQQKGQGLYASFEKDKITGINMVKIVDKKTNETISQMPPKEMIAFAQFLEHPQGTRGNLIYATA